MSAETILSVRNLTKVFPHPTKKGAGVTAVNDISFDVARGETFGIVGESGSGKTTTARIILGIEEATGGTVLVNGELIHSGSKPERKERRRNIAAVFQHPELSLNPRQTIGWSIAEPMRVHRIGTPEEQHARASEVLELVGLSSDMQSRKPHTFSGGQKQRIAIARAIVLEPSLVVLDEPVTALDVSVQNQIITLLNDLQEQIGLTYLFIAHDLALVQDFCDTVAVMYPGHIVEMGPVERVMHSPAHPYTRALLSAVPIPDPVRETARTRIWMQGPQRVAEGCPFRGRCPLLQHLRADEQRQCAEISPDLVPVDDHAAACHYREKSTLLTIR